MIIAISGTPGTGKHTIASILAKKFGYKVVDVNRLLRGRKEISVKELNRLVTPAISDGTIIVSHLSHLLESKRIDVFIVLRCDPAVLSRRLKRRRYGADKIHDNAVFEAIDGTYLEAKRLHKNVVQVDSTSRKHAVADMIFDHIKNGNPVKKFATDYSGYLLGLEGTYRKNK